jgi:hypothetical protein
LSEKKWTEVPPKTLSSMCCVYNQSISRLYRKKARERLLHCIVQLSSEVEWRGRHKIREHNKSNCVSVYTLHIIEGLCYFQHNCCFIENSLSPSASKCGYVLSPNLFACFGTLSGLSLSLCLKFTLLLSRLSQSFSLNLTLSRFSQWLSLKLTLVSPYNSLSTSHSVPMILSQAHSGLSQSFSLNLTLSPYHSLSTSLFLSLVSAITLSLNLPLLHSLHIKVDNSAKLAMLSFIFTK